VLDSVQTSSLFSGWQEVEVGTVGTLLPLTSSEWGETDPKGHKEILRQGRESGTLRIFWLLPGLRSRSLGPQFALIPGVLVRFWKGDWSTLPEVKKF
jgi:hypothetical protein